MNHRIRELSLQLQDQVYLAIPRPLGDFGAIPIIPQHQTTPRTFKVSLCVLDLIGEGEGREKKWIFALGF